MESFEYNPTNLYGNRSRSCSRSVKLKNLRAPQTPGRKRDYSSLVMGCEEVASITFCSPELELAELELRLLLEVRAGGRTSTLAPLNSVGWIISSFGFDIGGRKLRFLSGDSFVITLLLPKWSNFRKENLPREDFFLLWTSLKSDKG